MVTHKGLRRAFDDLLKNHYAYDKFYKNLKEHPNNHKVEYKHHFLFFKPHQWMTHSFSWQGVKLNEWTAESAHDEWNRINLQWQSIVKQIFSKKQINQ